MINEKGLQQIVEHLVRDHKTFCGLLAKDSAAADRTIHAYARDAEDNAENGNGAYFEISAIHSVTGQPVICVIGADGYDINE